MKKLFIEIKKNINSVIEEYNYLWAEFIEEHPVDIAHFLSTLSKKDFSKLFVELPESLKVSVFLELQDALKATSLSLLSDEEIVHVFKKSTLHGLSHFLEFLTDSDLKKYLDVLQKEDRERVLSLLKFSPDSAAGIMDIRAFSLRQDLTVAESIKIIRRVKAQKGLKSQVFVTDLNNRLVGHVNLEDFILQEPEQKIQNFIKRNELVVKAAESKEVVAKKMVKYHMPIIPVISDDYFFLGSISSRDIVEVIEEVAGDDVYKMSALVPMKRTYFETSFAKLIYERSHILILLLLAQSFSTMILEHYESMLQGFLFFFVTMLTSTGGNASSQTSAITIQGFATGELNQDNVSRFIRRECLMALVIASIVGVTAFARAYFFSDTQSLVGSSIVSITVFCIVLVATLFGFLFPIILRKIKVDPAFSAGPFLTTLMDILGLIIYCYIGKLILSYFSI
ncbi:magnesium transporter [bacterium]|jgi:magnesium transporter|nr:magnesium transporter [bacterium]